MGASRQKAGRILTRLGIATIEGVILGIRHVGESEPRRSGLRNRVLIAVGVLGDARNVVHGGPVPVVDGTRELGVVPVNPSATSVCDGSGCEHADRMLAYDGAVGMNSLRMGPERGWRLSWR